MGHGVVSSPWVDVLHAVVKILGFICYVNIDFDLTLTMTVILFLPKEIPYNFLRLIKHGMTARENISNITFR